MKQIRNILIVLSLEITFFVAILAGVSNLVDAQASGISGTSGVVNAWEIDLDPTNPLVLYITHEKSCRFDEVNLTTPTGPGILIPRAGRNPKSCGTAVDGVGTSAKFQRDSPDSLSPVHVFNASSWDYHREGWLVGGTDCIRYISNGDFNVTTVGGKCGTPGNKDGFPGTNALVTNIRCITGDKLRNVWYAVDEGIQRIKVLVRKSPALIPELDIYNLDMQPASSIPEMTSIAVTASGSVLYVLGYDARLWKVIQVPVPPTKTPSSSPLVRVIKSGPPLSQSTHLMIHPGHASPDSDIWLYLTNSESTSTSVTSVYKANEDSLAAAYTIDFPGSDCNSLAFNIAPTGHVYYTRWMTSPGCSSGPGDGIYVYCCVDKYNISVKPPSFTPTFDIKTPTLSDTLVATLSFPVSGTFTLKVPPSRTYSEIQTFTVEPTVTAVIVTPSEELTPSGPVSSTSTLGLTLSEELSETVTLTPPSSTGTPTLTPPPTPTKTISLTKSKSKSMNVTDSETISFEIYIPVVNLILPSYHTFSERAMVNEHDFFNQIAFSLWGSTWLCEYFTPETVHDMINVHSHHEGEPHGFRALINTFFPLGTTDWIECEPQLLRLHLRRARQFQISHSENLTFHMDFIKAVSPRHGHADTLHMDEVNGEVFINDDLPRPAMYDAIPRDVITASKMVAQLSVLFTIFTGYGDIAFEGQRARFLMEDSECEDVQSDPLGFLNHPTFVELGHEPFRIRKFAGACIMNLVVIVCFILIHHFIGGSIVYSFSDPKKTGTTRASARSSSYFPALALIPVSLLCQPTMMASTIVFRYSHSPLSMFLAVLALLFFLSLWINLLHLLTREDRFRAIFCFGSSQDDEAKEFFFGDGGSWESKDPTVEDLPIHREETAEEKQQYFWAPDISAPERQKKLEELRKKQIPKKKWNFVDANYHFFHYYREKRQWYGASELLISIALGLLDGWMPHKKGSCIALHFLSAMIFITSLIMSLTLKPFLYPYQRVSHHFISALQILASLCFLINQMSGAVGFLHLGGYASMTLMYFLCLRMLADFTIFYLRRSRRKSEEKHRQWEKENREKEEAARKINDPLDLLGHAWNEDTSASPILRLPAGGTIFDPARPPNAFDSTLANGDDLFDVLPPLKKDIWKRELLNVDTYAEADVPKKLSKRRKRELDRKLDSKFRPTDGAEEEELLIFRRPPSPPPPPPPSYLPKKKKHHHATVEISEESHSDRGKTTTKSSKKKPPVFRSSSSSSSLSVDRSMKRTNQKKSARKMSSSSSSSSESCAPPPPPLPPPPRKKHHHHRK